MEQVRAGQVAAITVNGSNSGASEALCQLKDGKMFRTVLPPDYRDVLKQMQDKAVNVEIRDPASGPLGLLIKGTPFLVLLSMWGVLMFWKSPKWAS